VVGGPDHGRRGCVPIIKLEPSGQTVSEPVDQVGLDEKRDGDPEDRQRVGDDDLPFETEQQYQCNKQCNDGDRGQDMKKLFLEPLLSFGADDCLSGNVARNQRKRHIDPDGKHQGLPGNRKPADTQ